MIIHKHCDICNKKAQEVAGSEKLIGGIKFIKLECGHTLRIKALTAKDLELQSEDGKKPYPYQLDGAKFVIEQSTGRALIADQMGLGKTVQSLMVVKNQKFRFLIIVKSGLRMQWFKETIRWCGFDHIPQIIEGETDCMLPFVKGFIVSIDLLYRFKDIEAWIKKMNPDVVILDECQTVKNHESKRTNQVRKIAENVKHFIALSGTPIKNNGLEYFPTLNILKPEKFPSLVNYQRQWLDFYYDSRTGKMKYGGIKDIDRFMAYTKDFILRRTREDVNDQIQLACGNEPKRDFRFSELGKAVEAMYQATMNDFTEYYLYSNDSEFRRSSNILAYMSKMRHITGLAKVDPVVDFIEDFLVEQPRERKFVLFCHHNDVMDLVIRKLEKVRAEWPAEFGDSIAQIRSEMDMNQRDNEVEKFRSDGCRIMIASTLASSEGLNLQFCSDYGIMERQWNPANEEQAEARFIRIGQQAKVVNGTYFIATGTIDEFFAELVEKKRAIMGQVLDGKITSWEDSAMMTELAEMLARSSKKGFKL